jgi:hypothetical protein
VSIIEEKVGKGGEKISRIIIIGDKTCFLE